MEIVSFSNCQLSMPGGYGKFDNQGQQINKSMKGQSEIVDMPKFNNIVLENSQTPAKWLEIKHNIIGNIDVDVGKHKWLEIKHNIIGNIDVDVGKHKWLEIKHNIIGNIDVDVGKFNPNDTLFL